MKNKTITLFMLMLGLLMFNHANADCTEATRDPNPGNTLRGNIFCIPDVCQEYHGNGDFGDYKKGPSDPVDPTKSFGSWSITQEGDPPNKFKAVLYSYNSFGDSGPYTLHNNGDGTVSFCDLAGGEVATGTLEDGLGPCGWAPTPAPASQPGQ